jgi:hypothetical protein
VWLAFISVVLSRIKTQKQMTKYILIIAILFQSCLLPKKLDKFFDKKPVLAAQKCAEKFPIKETIDTVIVVDSTTLNAYEMEFVYLYSMLDSLLGHQVSDSVKREIVTVFQEKKVPVIKYKYITRTVENTAKIQTVKDSLTAIIDELAQDVKEKHDEYLEASFQYVQEREKAKKYKKQRNINFWWIVLLLVFIFRKPIIQILGKLIKR